MQSIVNQYDPNHRYATYGTFEYAGWLDTYTYPYVSIDYSGFNNLGSNASSSEDGLINTKELYGLAGPVYSNALGAALENVHKYGGYGSSAMVNRDDAQYRVPADVPTNETDVNFKSVLSEVLKKNAYNLVTTTTGTGDEQITTTAPHIEASAIKWYLPAYGQFGSMPDWSGTGPQASQIWSSTVAPNIGSVSQAYLGVGQDARTTTHYVRAARNR